jgi:penicillin-binding protein 2
MSRFADETQNFDARLSTIQYVALAIFLVLGVRFWVLQVVHHDSYEKAATENRIRHIPIPAARGNILDRDGRILVDSRPAFNLIVNREDLKKQNLDELLGILRENLGIDPEWAKGQINDPLAPKSRPVVVKQNLTEADRAWVEAHEFEHPELHVELQPQRVYPLGPVLGHVLGYVGEISASQLEAELPEFSGAKSGDVVGQAGIERSHNQTLMGQEGSRVVVVDSRGRFVEEVERIEPIPGQDLVTTIDLDLQNVAEQYLAATKLNGTAVAMDPRTGEVLALASHPSYDPNLFAGGISPKDYATLRDNPDRPLRNRAIQDIYPPGSTWKVIMAMAALSEGAVKPTEPIACGGGISIGNRFAACHGSHGAPDVERAIAISCNGYFYRVGLRLGVDKIQKWASAMGLGRRTGIDLPNETAGYIPSADIKLRFKPKDKPADSPQYRWNDGDTVNASIGQGYDRPTPIQMLHATAGIAMNGHFTTPHLFKTARANAIRPEEDYHDEPVDFPLDPVAYTHVMQGMRQVVTNGTARRAEVPGFDVCGKTGTAQIASIRSGASGKLKEHAWFVGFAPEPTETRQPEIAISIIVENGGHGGVTCAPIAQAIITEYVRKKHPELLSAAGPAGAAASEAAVTENPDAVDLGAEAAAEEATIPAVATPDAAAAPAPTIVPRVDEPASPEGMAAPPAATPAPSAPQINPLQGIIKSREAEPSPPGEQRRRAAGGP